jgi:methyltransferase-like protein
MDSKKYYESQLSHWITPFSMTDDLRKKLKVEESNGIILMSFDDYLEKFRSTIICHASWKNSEKQSHHERTVLNHSFEPPKNCPKYLEALASSTVCYSFDISANVDI